MNRCKPCIVDLFWHLFLDICQGILPLMFDSHNPCTILHTQTYSHLWITWFFARSFSLNILIIRRLINHVSELSKITTDYGLCMQGLPSVNPQLSPQRQGIRKVEDSTH